MIYWDGAYRQHRPEDRPRFTRLATDAFPALDGRITCFGADWLGRQFATDSERIVQGVPQVLLVEPGTGEWLEIPVGEDAFHREELMQYPDAAVAYPFFRRWLDSGGAAPSYETCVGYRTPLYLGGIDDLSNLQQTDLDVYWTLTAQVLAKVRNLPAGTRVADVTIAD